MGVYGEGDSLGADALVHHEEGQLGQGVLLDEVQGQLTETVHRQLQSGGLEVGDLTET